MRPLNLLGTLIKADEIIGVTPMLYDENKEPYFVTLTTGGNIPITINYKRDTVDKQEEDLKKLEKARTEVIMLLRRG